MSRPEDDFVSGADEPGRYNEVLARRRADQITTERLQQIVANGAEQIWISADADELFAALSELVTVRTSQGAVTDAMRDRLERMRDLARTHAKMTNPPVSHEFQADADALEAALSATGGIAYALMAK